MVPTQISGSAFPTEAPFARRVWVLYEAAIDVFAGRSAVDCTGTVDALIPFSTIWPAITLTIKTGDSAFLVLA